MYDKDLAINTEIITEYDPEFLLEIIENFCLSKRDKIGEELEFDRNEEGYKAKIAYPNNGL